MCDLLWKCCKNIVDMTTFFLLFHRFLNFFFPSPFSAIPLPQLLEKNFIPLFRHWHCHNSFVNFFLKFFAFYFGHSTHGQQNQRKFGITVAEIQHFLSPPFSSSLSYFGLNCGNGNTEIQSLSSKSQITLNSTYNAN